MIVTPHRKLVSGLEVEEAFVPAHQGELNILPGHAPLVSTLDPGLLKYRLKGEDTLQILAISWGYVQVTPLGVNILAETAESKEEVNLEEVKKQLSQVHASLVSAKDPKDIEQYHRDRRWAEARMGLFTPSA